MSVEEARNLFLEKIEKRLADSGKPLSGFGLEYWQALAPTDAQVVDQMWKDKKRQGELDKIEKQFEAALCDTLSEDAIRNPASREVYLRALDDIKSADGIQLQAIVFAAAMRVKDLQAPDRVRQTSSVIAIAWLLVLGYWIGAHFSK
jgi:hypothetical protein